LVEVVGVIALIALMVRRYSKKAGYLLTIIALLGLIGGGGLIAWTANLGGKIRHVEIRSNIDDIISPTQVLYEGHKDD